jgi:preprotein translocase subunit YajC
MTDHAFPFVTILAQESANVPVPDLTASEVQGAQGAGGTAGTVENGASTPLPQPGSQQPGGFPPFFMILMLAFLGFMIFSTVMAGRKQKKARAQLMDAMGKHDRVLMNSGMIGTIVEMKDAEVVLRIDDATGTRATFTREAVASILKPASAPAD